MGLFDKLRAQAGSPQLHSDVEGDGAGLFLFADVPEALRAEKVLIAAGYDVRLVAPPPHLRAGCDLAVALPRVERPGAERTLATADVETSGWADTLEGGCEVTDMVTSVDFGEWLMVRSGNMKITVEKATGRIVNTSGGGCPDIPHLNLEMVGKLVSEAPRPKDIGYTLCGLMLDRAYLEVLELHGGDAS